MTLSIDRRALGLCLALAAPAAALAGSSWRHDGGFTVNTQRDVESCDDIQVQAHGRAVALGQERFTLPVSGAPFQVTAAHHSATVVRGSTGAEIEVLVCKAAAARSAALADDRLARIEVRSSGRQLTTRGPEDGDSDWFAYVIVRAPRGAAIDVEIQNGPLSISDADGTFRVRGANGPVVLRDVAGDVEVELQNGPVSIAGGSGSTRLRTQNGPIDVRLDGREWEGEGLDARAVNGPLQLQLDRAYAGGVVVESSDHSPWHCRDACREAARTWDDDHRRVEFGSGPVRVRLSTVNGPVQITNDGGRRSGR